MNDSLWENSDLEARDFVTVPRWIEQDITLGSIAGVCEGGCKSGSYTPSVTYWTAVTTMREHDDLVEEYLDDHLGMEYLETIPERYRSFAGIAVYMLSMAVELWCYNAAEDISRQLDNE